MDKKPDEVVVDDGSPKVRARIVIVLYEDGQLQVDGPMEDRITYNGMLFMAHEIGHDYAQQSMERARTAAIPPKRFSKAWWDMKRAERDARKAAEKAKKVPPFASGPKGPEENQSQGGTPSEAK